MNERKNPTIGPERDYLPNESSQVLNEAYYRPQRRNNRRLVGLALLIVGGLWLGSLLMSGAWLPFGTRAGAVSGGSYTVAALSIDLRQGNVEVRTWDQPTTKLDIAYNGGSPDDYDIKVAADGDLLRISGGAKPCFLFCVRPAPTYQISTPAASNAQVTTVNGTIDVAGLRGNVALKSTNGSIQAANVPNGLAVTATNGEIALRAVGGTLSATTTNGDLELTDGVLSAATVQSTNGDIALAGVKGPVKVRNTNGSITIADATDGQLTLSNTNGDITYKGSLAANTVNTLETVSGDVRVELPAASQFGLNVATVSGDIDTDFDQQASRKDSRNVAATINGGGATLNINTVSGDVAVRQR